MQVEITDFINYLNDLTLEDLKDFIDTCVRPGVSYRVIRPKENNEKLPPDSRGVKCVLVAWEGNPDATHDQLCKAYSRA